MDDQIKVERKLRRRSTSKALLGGTRTIDIAYEITVENHRDRDATVSVHDHIPVSTDGDVKVRARETSPPPAETDDLGELTWNLALAPRAVGHHQAPLHRRAPGPGRRYRPVTRGSWFDSRQRCARANRRKRANLVVVGGEAGVAE